MKSNRRQFLRASALSVPFILPSRVWSADVAPSERITMGFIGMGKQSDHLLRAFLGQPGVEVVAVCDVDKTRREHAAKKVAEHYAAQKTEGWKGCMETGDFRDVVGRKDIDAVCIATPDHWHAIITVAALKAGKDVYCEKPLTHNIHEAVTVMAAVEAEKRVLQTGSMQRSSGEFRVACELVRNGVIGKLVRAEVQFGPPPLPCNLPEEAMEPGLDWDRWLGPAPVRPYNSVLSPRGVHGHFPDWRMNAEYGGGMITDWGAHHLDIAHWGLGVDDSGPVELRAPEGCAELLKERQNGKVEGCELVYGNGVVVKHVQKGFGAHFFGENGEVKVNRGQFEVVLNGKVAYTKGEKTSVERAYMTAEKELLKDAAVKLYKSTNHMDDFLKAVRARTKPITSEIVGGRSAIACHLINIAYRTGKNLKWDPAANTFREDSCALSELTRSYRGEWKV
jgi:predicted dehydrogenase